MGCEDPVGQFVCLGIRGTVEALIGFKLKKDVTGIPVWYSHLVLSLGYHGTVVLGRAKLEAKEQGKDICLRKIMRAPAEKCQQQGIRG